MSGAKLIPAVLRLCTGVPLSGSLAFIGNVSCEQLALASVDVLLNTQTMTVVFIAPCGCKVEQSLSPALAELAAMQASGHTPVTH